MLFFDCWYVEAILNLESRHQPPKPCVCASTAEGVCDGEDICSSLSLAISRWTDPGGDVGFCLLCHHTKYHRFPAVLLALRLIQDWFHVPTWKRVVEYKMISSSWRWQKALWMATWNLWVVLVVLHLRNGYGFLYLYYSVLEETPSTVNRIQSMLK